MIPVCAPPIGAFVVECLGHATLHNTCISLHSTTTRDGYILLLCTNHQVVQKFFSPWNHCRVVLRALGILTLSLWMVPLFYVEQLILQNFSTEKESTHSIEFNCLGAVVSKVLSQFLFEAF
jgi:hypothetical protein